jgi:hypothetical protein
MLWKNEGNPGNDILPQVPDLYQVLADPAVRGALTSLLGPEYIVHPHRHCHSNPSGSRGQSMHQDSYEQDENVRHHRNRWAMAFYYPQDVALENGPSSAIPATQYYNCSEQANGHVERPLLGPAGTVTIVHYDLWHRAKPNNSEHERFMVKFLFTRMREPDSPSWNHAGSAWQPRADGPPDALCRRNWQWLGAEAQMQVSTEEPQHLAERLQDPSETKRLSAAYDLASLGDAGVPLLVEALRAEAAAKTQRNLECDQTNPCQFDVAFALSAAGSSALAPMCDMLAEEAWYLRAAAADILGDSGNDGVAAEPLLRRALADENAWVRRNATEALGHMGPQAAASVSALARCLNDPDVQVRHNAALSLAKIGPAAAEATPQLNQALGDDNLYVRENARIALAHIAI